MTDDIAALIEIIDHFAANNWRPGEDWAFPDDNSSLCLDHRLPDGTKFWLDIERNGVVIFWKRPDSEAQTLRLSLLTTPPLPDENGIIPQGDCVLIPKPTYKRMVENINELQVLRAQPLPDEIAGLIERWEKRIAWTAKWEIDDRLDNDTIAALRALAHSEPFDKSSGGEGKEES